jgi:hypothetical protein
VQAGEFPPLELAAPRRAAELVQEIVEGCSPRTADKRFADAGQLHEQLLGYFYASGERFGANDLAEFLAPLPRESGRGAARDRGRGVFERRADRRQRPHARRGAEQPGSRRSEVGLGA